MRARVGSLLVQAASRQASLYGVQRASHVSSNPSTSILLKSTVVNTPARSWNGTFHNESRTLLSSVHHVSTAAAQVTEVKPSPFKDEENAYQQPALQDSSEKPTDIASY